MKKALLALLAIILTSPNQAETLESKDGRKIEVEIVKKDDEKVWFKRAGNRQLISYELSKLSATSQKLVENWEPPKSNKFKVDYSSGKRNQASGYEDRAYTMKPKITLKNEDQKAETPTVKAHFFVFGKPIKYRRTLCLIHKETFAVDSIAPLDETILTTKKDVHFEYDDRGIVHGARYKGYLLVLTDSEGKEVFRKGVPEKAYDAPLTSIQKMEVAAVYTDDMEPMDAKVYLK